MPVSSRAIRAKLRQRDKDEQQKREDAVVAVAEAAAAAVKAREDHELALRAAFEAALKARDDDERERLRATFEAALVENAAVAEAEVAAGRAVLAAGDLRVTQAALAEFTEHRVEELRRWAQAARRAGAGGASGRAVSADTSDGDQAAVRPAAGFALVSGAATHGGGESRGGGGDDSERRPGAGQTS